MSKGLHNIDYIFKAAYQELEEEPSAAVWEGINAGLDKKDAEPGKKRFIVWKKAIILLLLLLAGFLLYDSEILKTGYGRSNKIADKKISSQIKQNELYHDNTSDKKARNDKVDNINGSVIEDNNFSDQRELKKIAIPLVIGIYNGIVVKEISIVSKQKNLLSNDFSNLFAANIKNEIWRTGDPWKKERVNLLQSFGVNNTKNVWQPQSPPVKDFLLKNLAEKNISEKRAKLFNPFWLMTGFASYEQVGYKLDSDEPGAITSLRHREAHEPSFSGGILLTRQLTPRWGLQTGLLYSKTAIGMKPQKTYAFKDPTGDIGYKYITSSGYAFIKPGFGPQPAIGDSLTTAEAKHTIEYISVPLVIKHTISNKKISITPGAGIEANFITKANLEVDIEDPFNREIVVIRKLTGTKLFYWSFVADAELRYPLTKKIAVTIRPVYRYAISPITKNNVVETFPHSFGLGGGLTIKL